ncbi:hypothetical protein B1NLA3E_07595 [Bacillus sp. 1NLA3E]|nr:hypothetical protein B1NLA3E_07595 [Bacillus sp. 1NLA3E]
MDLLQFLNENYFMLIPVLWVLGFALKQTPHVPNWSIIWILTVVSLVFGCVSFGFTYEAIMNSIVAAGVAVYGHQLFKQTKNSKFEK